MKFERQLQFSQDLFFTKKKHVNYFKENFSIFRFNFEKQNLLSILKNSILTNKIICCLLFYKRIIILLFAKFQFEYLQLLRIIFCILRKI